MSVKDYRRLENCTLCSRAFVAILPNQKFCCAECRETAKKAAKKKANERYRAKKKASEEKEECGAVTKYAKEQGISYAEAQRRMTLELVKKWYGPIVEGSEEDGAREKL